MAKIVMIRPRESPGRTLATCTAAERSAAGRGGGRAAGLAAPEQAAVGRVGGAKCNIWDSGRKSNSERAAGGRHPGGRKPGGRQPGGTLAEGFKSYTFLNDSGRGAKCNIWDSDRKSNYLAYCTVGEVMLFRPKCKTSMCENVVFETSGPGGGRAGNCRCSF